MVVFLGLLMALGVLAALGYPLLRPRPAEEGSTLDALLGRRAAREALGDIELDAELGNLSEEDRRRLEAELKRGVRRGASAVARIEEDLAEEIEREVRRLRRGTARALRCPRCGSVYERGNRFCSECGAGLAPEQE